MQQILSVFHFSDCLVSSLLLCSFLGMSYAGSHYISAYQYVYGKALIMIWSLFFHQTVLYKVGSLLLYDFLQDGLAIVKELFVLKVIQDKFQYKLLCTSKTTVQINSSKKSFCCIGND